LIEVKNHGTGDLESKDNGFVFSGKNCGAGVGN